MEDRADDAEPPYKRLRLSLEQPYKDDNGERILQLLDITPDGERVYKPREEPIARLGDNLSRIIRERGIDFFDKYKQDGSWREHEPSDPSGSSSDSDSDDAKTKPKENDDKQRPMTAAELFEMRSEMIPHLYTAMGEMTLARDLLALLASSSLPGQPSALPNLPGGTLTGSVVSRPPPLPSVALFNSQLTLGAKDKALRQASDVLRDAAENMERTRRRDETYWVNALTARAANWSLVPAPLPPGAPMGKNADRTARDFAISFGLEEAPYEFKQRALAYLSAADQESPPVVFQHRQRLRLRISLVQQDADGTKIASYNTLRPLHATDVNSTIHYAQQEVVEQEIFQELFKEAEKYPTGDTKVSERLIVVSVGHTIELCFTLVPSLNCDDIPGETSPLCDLVHSSLILLLLRRHSFVKKQGFSEPTTLSTLTTTSVRQPPPPVLQPIVDLVQYQTFCERVTHALRGVCTALWVAGVHAKMRMTHVGDRGADLVGLFNTQNPDAIGGEAVLRVARRPTLRLTFHAPAALVAQTSKADVTVGTIAQLSQVLNDEVALTLLERISELGKAACCDPKALWFVDDISSRTMGRWAGHSATFRVSLESGSLVADAWTIRSGVTTAVNMTYSPSSGDLFKWVKGIIANLSAQ